jgi:small subunit ribosomal protein S6
MDSKGGIFMKGYELTVLIHPDLEVDLEASLEKVRKLVTDNGGKIVSEDNWGKKRLMYRIKGQDFGVYIYMDLELPAEAPLKISNTLNITDEVLRYLLVKVDEKGRALLADAKKRAEERGETADDDSEE